MEDRRAHQRIDKLEQAIEENTILTRQLVDNTTELVILVKGAKGLRAFILWITPIIAAIMAIWFWIKDKS